MDRQKANELLTRLLSEGTTLLATKKQAEWGGEYVDASQYVEWTTNVIVCCAAVFGNDHSFTEQAKQIVHVNRSLSNASRTEQLIATLKSAVRAVVDQTAALVDDVPATSDPVAVLKRVFDRFHSVVKQLRVRRKDYGDGRTKQPRPTLNVTDEYDVQELLHSLLWLWFDDIRREEWTPSVANASKRIDLILGRESVAIETKMTRPGMTETSLVDELIIDIRNYKGHPRCKTLVVFVYDPTELISNAAAIEDDLAEHTDGFPVHVFVRGR